EKLQPGYKAGLTKAQQTADSLAKAQIPADVAQKVSQSAAFKGLMTGLPGEQRKSVEARDLGLTSLDLMGRGLAAQQNLRAEANAMMPLQALNLAFSPQAIRAEDVRLAEYNNQIKNRQADANASTHNRQQDMNYQYDQQYGGSPFSGILGGLGGGLAGAGIGFAMGGPAGALMGAGMGAQVGGGIGGGFGGAQGQQMGGIFSGLGSSLAGLGTLYGSGGFGSAFNSSTGTYGSRGAAMDAAPFAAGYTQTPEGWVPRASPRTP
ncbi:MAG: hypothetical protein EBZ78_10285, partial [Verrucomicrobia bacterium]|nr:hypothetical protein [Verrucomicrobiota bacterium]